MVRIHSRLLTTVAAVLAVSLPIAGAAVNAQAGTIARQPLSSGVSQGGTSGSETSYNGLALTPPMGYNDFYQFTSNIDEATVMAQANALVSSGLAAKGYKYVNLDAYWSTSSRDANGNLVADPVKFPHGIKWLADYVHSLGLKLGIYTSAGATNCDGTPGLLGHEQQDAQTFASWGVDFVKSDWCSGIPPNASTQQLVTKMSDALRATGRPIVFSYETGPESWSPSVANMWRIGPDLLSFQTVLANFRTDLGLADFAGPGHWNDMDMLLIGTTTPGFNFVKTVQQQQTVMSIWSEEASPLLISNDLTNMSPDTLRILGNTDVIAVDQDSLGKQGRLVAQQGPVAIVAKPLAGGDVALLMVNMGSTKAAVASLSAKAIGIKSADTYALKNLWTGQITETAGTIAASIPPYGSVMYRVSPGQPTSGAPSSLVSIDPSSLGMPAGVPGNVTVAYTNTGSVAAQKVSLSLQPAASGWTMRVASPSFFPAVPPGKTVSAKWTVTPAATASTTSPAAVSLTARARYDWPSSDDAAEADASAPVYVLSPEWQSSVPSLASAFDSVGITDDSSPGGDLFTPFGDWSYSAQALAAAGFSPGATVQVGGLSFKWPDVAPGNPDNVNGGPNGGPWKVIAAPGRGSTLGMLGATACCGGTLQVLDQNILEQGLVVYTDGTADPYTLDLADWHGNPDSAANPSVSAAAAMRYFNFSKFSGPTGQGVRPVFLDLMKIPVNPDKQVAAVLLPDDLFFHVFSVAVGSPN